MPSKHIFNFDLTKDPFDPEEFGFFLREDHVPPWGVQYFEKDHLSIDKTITKDWRRHNLFLSKDNDFVCIWYGGIDSAIAEAFHKDHLGKDFEFWDYYQEENLFSGYIRNRFEAMIILKSVRIEKYFPWYMGT